jgi:hypothetical protein
MQDRRLGNSGSGRGKVEKIYVDRQMCNSGVGQSCHKGETVLPWWPNPSCLTLWPELPAEHRLRTCLQELLAPRHSAGRSKDHRRAGASNHSFGQNTDSALLLKAGNHRGGPPFPWLRPPCDENIAAAERAAVGTERQKLANGTNRALVEPTQLSFLLK